MFFFGWEIKSIRYGYAWNKIVIYIFMSRIHDNKREFDSYEAEKTNICLDQVGTTSFTKITSEEDVITNICFKAPLIFKSQ